jgi:UDP:flavonoid glycosyltransferase YjiC (YdhE family)
VNELSAGRASFDGLPRVLFVISQLDATGGAGRPVAGLARALRNAVAEVELACFRRTFGRLEEELERAGVVVRELGASHMAAAMLGLRRLLRQTRPDVIHTTLYTADQAGRLAAWHTGIPVVSSLVNPTHDAALPAAPTCPPWRRNARWALYGWTARHRTEHAHAHAHAITSA